MNTISDDEIGVQLALIKLGVITGDEIDTALALVLWNRHLIAWRRVSNKHHALVITDDGEAFLNK